MQKYTFSEALDISRKTGQSFSRANPKGNDWIGWIKYHPGHKFHSLSHDDLTLRDWITSEEMIRNLTNGDWELAQ